MPVKKTIRRKKSTRQSLFAWAVTRAQRGQRAVRGGARAIRTQVANRFVRITSSMDRSMTVAMLTTGALILAMLVAGYRTMPAPAGNDVELTAPSAAHEDARIATPSITHAVADSRTVQSTTPVRVATSQMVTIAGCLAQDGDTFRLKDTSGAEAPRSRNWKSGFLKKSASSVDVVDASRRLKLTNHVGERISVTGTLVDGEMQVRSLRRVSTSCADTRPKVNA